MILRDYILNNFWWKLLSLLLAGLTWLTIWTAFRRDEARRDSPIITTRTSIRAFAAVPITVLAEATNTNRYRVNPPTVSVEVGGSSNELFRLQVENIKAFVDLTEAGDQKEFRRPIQTQVPGELKVTGLSSTNARVERIIIVKQP